jgi:hypothetical protein
MKCDVELHLLGMLFSFIYWEFFFLFVFGEMEQKSKLLFGAFFVVFWDGLKWYTRTTRSLSGPLKFLFHLST